MRLVAQAEGPRVCKCACRCCSHCHCCCLHCLYGLLPCVSAPCLARWGFWPMLRGRDGACVMCSRPQWWGQRAMCTCLRGAGWGAACSFPSPAAGHGGDRLCFIVPFAGPSGCLAGLSTCSFYSGGQAYAFMPLPCHLSIQMAWVDSNEE